MGIWVVEVIIGFAVYLTVIAALAVWRDHHDGVRPKRRRQPDGTAAPGSLRGDGSSLERTHV